MSRYTLRRRVRSLAALLVASAQLLTLVPVLSAVKADVAQRAREAVTVGGAVFEDLMRGRSEQLRATADGLVSDLGFRRAVARTDVETIQSVLVSHSRRIGAELALLLDRDGNVLAGSSGAPTGRELAELRASVLPTASFSAREAVIYSGSVPYQAVVVPLRAPLPAAWVAMGFEIDHDVAARIETLTGLAVSFLDLEREPEGALLASTLPLVRRPALADALRGIQAGSAELPSVDVAGAQYLTMLQPLSSASGRVQVALQLSLADAMAHYRDIRTILLLAAVVSLLAAVAGACWLAQTVTEPLRRLVAGMRRLREGVYSQPIDVPELAELGELARGFNVMQQAIAEREQRIADQAYHDSLSGLPNRERFLDQLEPALAAADRLSVISLSVDRFAQIASSLGHEAADETLKCVAEALERHRRDGQYLAHLGGNDFVVACPGTGAGSARRWVEALGRPLRAGVDLRGASISLQVTAGVALFPTDGRTGPELLRRAAAARTNAQIDGAPFAVFRPEYEEWHRRQTKLVGDFPDAVDNGELVLCLQPKISCARRALVGAEALVRWDHPELGLLPPAEFIDLIERAGLIGQLTRWVIAESIAHCRRWHDAGLELTVAINLSVNDLLDEKLPSYLADCVEAQGIRPSDVTLEITESAIMHDVSLSLSVLQRIRDLGFGVALDDFGTGQSSLTQLRRLPLNELKIDKSFIIGMSDRKDDVIVAATIELAHRLGLRVVGEGVESLDLLERLEELGCEYAQGYYISKPLAADLFTVWARRWQLAHGLNVVELRRHPAGGRPAS